MNNIKKNIAVIGCGHWGKNLVRNFYDIGSLVAVCDPEDKIADFYAQKYKVKNLSFIEVLNDKSIDGVVLAVPAVLHSSMSIEAMKAGKHVYVEKPLAMNKFEAQAMIDTSNKTQTKLMVGHLLQYHPIFIELKRITQSGKLGKIKYIYSNRLSFGKIRLEEDVIWSFAPHDISMILSLVNEVPQTISTESSKILQSDIADIAIIHLKFKSGIKAHISVSWLHPGKEQKIVVIGSDASLIFDDTLPWSQKLAIHHNRMNSSDETPTIYKDKDEVEYVDVNQSEPLRNECEHFMDVVNNKSNPLTDGNEGLKVLDVLERSSLSESNNTNIKFEDL
jgi:predicted dehydrogenase